MTKKKRHRRAFVATYIYDSLRQSIIDGVFQVDSNLPSENILCEQYGASRMTIRSALKRLAADRMIESQPGRGWKILTVNPSPEIKAAGPILLLNPGYAEAQPAFNEAAKVLKGKGLDVLHMPGCPFTEVFQQHPVVSAGGLIAYSGTPLPEELVAAAQMASLPIICMMLAEQVEYDTIAPDHHAGTMRILERLYNEGCTSIAYISSHTLEDGGDPSFRVRFRAYEEFAKNKGMKSSVFLSKYNYPFSNEDGKKFCKWLGTASSKKIDAVFCTTSIMTEFVLVQLTQNGLSASKDLRVSGASFNFHKSLLENHKLKSILTVDAKTDELGVISANRLIQRLQGDTMPPTLTLTPMNLEMRSGINS